MNNARILQRMGLLALFSRMTAKWRPRIRGYLRRSRANYHYLKRPILDFLPVLGFTATTVVIGGICFHYWYLDNDGNRLSGGIGEAIYLNYCLIFMEHLYDYPRSRVLQVFYWGLPLLGLLVVLDGLVRFGSRVFSKDETCREWIRAMARTMENHVVLCGLGNLGLRILQQLLHLGEEVIVLEKDPLCPNLAFARKNGVPIMIGTGREEGIFDDLNVAKAKSIILATNNDLANLEMSLDARAVKADIRVVLRMFDQELASKVRGSFDIQQAFSTSAISAPLFATSSSDQSIINSFYVDDKLLVVASIAIRPESQLIGRNIRSLRTDHRIFVISHQRGSESRFYPEGELTLQAADRVTLQAEPSTLRTLHEWNKDPLPY